MESCYVPNNPTHYGLDWAEDMGSFSLPPLDLDPLPSLFPFSPCSSSGNLKSECSGPGGLGKPPHEVADVLLSLKHAVVHPGQMTPPISYGGAESSCPSYQSGHAPHQQFPTASLSYTVHPHQMVSMSPSDTSYGQGAQYGCTMEGQWPGHHQTPLFPAMSVNVSMNMTMHPTYAPASMEAMPCAQMQWAPPDNSSLYQTQGLLSPDLMGGNYMTPSATYSFTADFRPQSAHAQQFMQTAQPEPPFICTSPLKSQPQYIPSPPTSYLQSPIPPMTSQPLKRPKLTSSPLSSESDSESVGDGKPNLCRICGKTYARPSTLKTHLRTHSGEKPYRCEDCNKSFSQAANLTAHVRTHSGEKPFRCPICDRRFSQSSSVTTHMRTHSGERPYRCRLCKKAFSDSSTLTKHLRIHSGEKPYQCKLCLLRFSQSGNLNRHMRVHGAQYAMLPV